MTTRTLGGWALLANAALTLALYVAMSFVVGGQIHFRVTAATPTSAQTPPPASSTWVPTPSVPLSEPLSIVQSLSAFTTATLAPRVGFAQPISVNDGLIAMVAVVSDSASKLARVSTVSDTLGNTWTRLVSGTTASPHRDELAADIWFASASTSGADAVTATLAGSEASGGGVRIMLTMAEVRGPVVPDGGSAAASSGTRHVPGGWAANSGDLVVGVFVADGDDRGAAIGDGKAQLGVVCEHTVDLQGDQSYGAGPSALFTTVSSTTGEVAAAALRTP